MLHSRLLPPSHQSQYEVAVTDDVNTIQVILLSFPETKKETLVLSHVNGRDGGGERDAAHTGGLSANPPQQ